MLDEKTQIAALNETVQELAVELTNTKYQRHIANQQVAQLTSKLVATEKEIQGLLETEKLLRSQLDEAKAPDITGEPV